ncbi:hypothetical protein LC085_04485 [Bacillus tianshenii]|uniref:hypothetical protein n=1 Tax=Sutcliffiella tianshenii TaxID=1463404 RepID=UPI001CD4B873|nr:hypothetical protein [Bacillus tianshenii]MCA1319162.1 hypothetical protein [Bacillus tianshenii]
MDSLFTLLSITLLGGIVYLCSSLMTRVNRKIQFLAVIIPMVSINMLYSVMAQLTNLLPILITMTTLLSLLGIWTVNRKISTGKATDI